MTSDRRQGKHRKRKSSTDSVEQGSDTLTDAVQYFTSRDVRPKLRGNVALQMALEKVEEVATTTGLPGAVLCHIMDAVTSGIFPTSVTTRLIKSLIPASVVPRAAVLKAVSWMCTNEPPTNIQTLLIRWLVLVLEALEAPSELHALYHILFYFMESAAMCRDVCHLLYLLTRKEDVKIFRIRQLLRLQKKMGSQPYLLGLLSIYKLYQPKLIIVPNAAKVFFRLTDRNWSSKVRAVLDRRRVDRPLEGDTVQRTVLSQDTKRSRLDVIPSVQASSVGPVVTQPTVLPGSKPLEPIPMAQISSFTQLLQNFDRLELPGQMAAALNNRNLQHVLLSYPDPAIATRIAYWLDHVLCEEFLLKPSKVTERREHLLKMLIKFSEFLMEGIPVCENFLVKFLHMWNGSDFRVDVLLMVSRFRLYPFQKLNDLLFEPLRKLFFCSSVYFKCQLMMCLTSLLRNFCLVELPRYKYCAGRQGRLENIDTSSIDDINSHCVFSQDVEDFSPEETIFQCIEYINTLLNVALAAETGNALLMHCALRFYELVAELHQNYGMPFVTLPGMDLVYRAVFSLDAVSLSRVCTIVCRYRKAFISLRRLDQSSLTEPEQVVHTLSLKNMVVMNSYLMDISDLLWRNKAFSTKDMSFVCKFVKPANLQKLHVQEHDMVFALRNHPALLGSVVRFMKKNVPPGTRHHPITIKHLHDELLQFLEMDHISGVPQFIATNIKRK